jgi:hypothetical protein
MPSRSGINLGLICDSSGIHPGLALNVKSLTVFLKVFFEPHFDKVMRVKETASNHAALRLALAI